LPAIRPWLLEAGFQEKTSSVMDCLNSLVMNSTAATVSGELMTTRSFSSCTEAPNDHIRARPAMLESISWDMPMPSWVSLVFLISAPPWSSSSQVLGPLGMPTAVHSEVR
jgi:hypothetical protein